MAITVRQYTPRVDVIGSYAYPPGRGAIRYKQTKIIRLKLLKTGRRGDVRRSTFSLWRRASISASSDAFERNRPRSIHLIRLSRSRIEHSSPDSDPQAKRTEFAVATGLQLGDGWAVLHHAPALPPFALMDRRSTRMTSSCEI